MAGAIGNVILLVGTSCAGKSTLARAVQAISPRPYLAQSLDALFAATPEGWGSGGAHADEGFRYDWGEVPADCCARVRRIAYGPVGWRLLQGFHRAVGALALAGVDVIVDDMLIDREVLADWAEALEGIPTLLALVTAPKEELLRREAARRLHPTPGLVEGHFDLHEGVAADVRIDTSAVDPAQAARSLLEHGGGARQFGALQACRRA